MSEIIRQHFAKYAALFELMNSQDSSGLEAAGRAVASAFLSGGKLYICGCGISEFMADYVAALFLQHPEGKRPPYPAVSLSSRLFLAGTSTDEIYEKQLIGLATADDVVLGFATGHSECMMKALRVASSVGAGVISVTGADCALYKGVSDIHISVPHVETLPVQWLHMIVAHTLCAMVDDIIFEHV